MSTDTDVRQAEKVPWFPWPFPGKRPFYGWVIVTAGWLGSFCQGIVNQAFTTYLTPLQQEFGWSRAVLAGPRSVTQVEGAILGPLEGYLVDRFGPRLVVSIGAFVVGLGLICFGLVQELWQYYLANMIIAIGSGLAGLLVVSTAINHWFRRRRTITQAVYTTGFAMAGIFGIPVIVWLQGSLGWREAAIITGIAVWIIALPAALCLRRSPEAYGLHPDGDETADPSAPAAAAGHGHGRALRYASAFSFTLQEALRTRTFWFICIGNGLNGLAQSAMMVHLFLHLEQGIGLSRTSAALVWTVTSTVNIPARLAVGVLGDRLPKHLVLGSCVGLMGVGILFLGLAQSLPAALVFAVLYGAGWGGRAPVQNAIHGQYWGLTSLGKITGMAHTMAVPLSIAGPVVAGLLADVYGDYRIVFISLSVASLIGAGLTLLAAPPKPPTASEDQRADSALRPT